MPRVDVSLYLVTDRHQTNGRPLVPLIEQAVAGGLRVVQLRERDLDAPALLTLARDVQVAIKSSKALLLINDRVDVALACGAAGVHLRSDSLPVGVARKLLGAARIIGVSTHSVDEAVRAEAEGADFVVVGPIYDTPSKREYGAPLGVQSLEEAARRCRIPVLAIGGITPARLPEVKRAGASGAAVVSSILSASSIEAATKQFIALWASL
ncbi:MAG: thiamine phosphate synthase [Nitrospira sp.]|nr:thiamine phosphate synthase [Nitrospira sp.]